MNAPDPRSRVVRSGERAGVRLAPADGSRPADGDAAEITAVAMDTHGGEQVRAVARGGAWEGEFSFAGEQEYRFLLGEQVLASRYSLLPDLFARTPYKGDFHIHSNRSDGALPPADVAAGARGIGMDFLAITDHFQYQPSLEAISAFAGYGGSMLLLPGEEVHPPGNPVHIINFGGSFSVNALFDDCYAREVAALSAASGLSAANAPLHAGCAWCFGKIAEAGGLSIFCHPHWVTENRYNVHPELRDRLFADRAFGAFELLGGHECESNALQVAYWNQMRAEGLNIPIVGVSDAHQTYPGGDFFGWTYTVLFASDLSLGGIRESVTNGYSVAVETLPGEKARCYGSCRLVKYALFLLREYFPEHDRFCAADGENMKAHLEQSRPHRGISH